jgi:hypothetical protein
MSEARPAPVLRYRNLEEMVAAFPEPRDHYEANGVLLLEDCGLDYDHAFVQRITFPPQWKKFGTVNALTVPPVVFVDGQFRRTQNPLGQMIKEDAMLLKTYSELLRLELGFKLLVLDVFSTYRNILWVNCTFRFTRTEDEPPHVDVFNEGRAFLPEQKLPRVKFFMNVDSQPRIWNVGPTLPEVLKHSGGALGVSLPEDVNMLCDLVNNSGILERFPYSRVEIPPRGIVFANGATVVHQVVFGQRMVALEGLVPRECVAQSEWDRLGGWIADAGYRSHVPPATREHAGA